MIKYYRTMDHQIHEISEPMEGTWISLIHPTAAELAKIATDYKIDIDDLRAPLDEEERSHIEVEEGYTLFTAVHGDEKLQLRIQVIGVHMVQNALAALALA